MFGKAELAALLAAAEKLHLGAPARLVPTKSGAGVCSRAAVLDGLRQVIDSSTERVTFSELSRRLDVDDKYISSVLETMPEDEWGVNGRELVPKKPFVILENDLRARLTTEVVTVVKYCLEKEVQVDFLKRLLDYLAAEWDVDARWLGGQRYVYAAGFFEEEVERVKSELDAASGPIDFAELQLFKAAQYPAEFAQRLQARVLADADMDGFWTGDTFVPSRYKAALQEAVLTELASCGFIDHKALKRAYIDRPDAFFENWIAGVTALSEHYVTQDWLEKVELAGMQSLDKHRFIDIREHARDMSLREQAHIQEFIRKKQTRKLLSHGGFLVTQDLVALLTREGVTYAGEQADKAWATAVETTVPISTVTPLPWRRLLDFFTTSHEEVPQSALESIAQTAAPKAAARYAERVAELREAANGASRAVFMDKIYLRFQVNMAAVSSIQDAGLQDKLAQDLVGHYHKIILDGITKLLDRVADSAGRSRNERIEDAAVSIAETCTPTEAGKWMDALRGLRKELGDVAQIIGADDEASDDALLAKKAEMQAELKTSLARATDASLMMLVVLILLLSETGDGVLRASGKYAPKLLKLLRPKMADADYQFLSDIKSAVIAKASLASQDVDKLRALCL